MSTAAKTAVSLALLLGLVVLVLALFSSDAQAGLVFIFVPLYTVLAVLAILFLDVIARAVWKAGDFFRDGRSL